MAHNEQVFTPQHIVNEILFEVMYDTHFENNTEYIRKKHIIDNSCGNGNFLVEIVSRYIDACRIDKLTDVEIVNELETYIHGIEINEKLWREAKRRCREVCEKKNIEYHVNFDIKNVNTLYYYEYDGKMDYVVGNPPYCKVHDLKENYDKVKEFSFAQDGMTDLYLVFFEKGIKMLNEKGKLGYITPNSWMTSLAGKKFRKWLQETKKLYLINNFEGNKVFDNVTTFTNITIVMNDIYDDKFYFHRNGSKLEIGNLKKSFINEKFYLGTDEELNRLNDIISTSTYHKVKVKNGFATLNDKLFIMKTDWKKDNIFENNLISIWKASKDKLTTAIYPYDRNGKPIKYQNLYNGTQEILNTQSYLLEVDTTKEDWHLYGRYQGIKDMPKYRIGINNIVKDADSIHIRLLKPYEGIYSGLYIVCEEDDNFILNNFGDIVEKIKNIKFIEYVKLLGKFKNGGYYTFSSKDLENYLNYVLVKDF